MSGDRRDFNNIETRAVIKFIFLQGKASKEIHAILTETLACFLLGWAKDLSALLYISHQFTHCLITPSTPFPLYDKSTHTRGVQFYRNIYDILPLVLHSTYKLTYHLPLFQAHA